jgi:predicted O-methyltransferase YrrM
MNSELLSTEETNELNKKIENHNAFVNTTNDHSSTGIPKTEQLTNICMFSKKAANILQIGFHSGYETVAMLVGNKDANITIIDSCQDPNVLKYYDHLNELFPNRLMFYIGDSIEICSELKLQTPNHYDLIYLNGCTEYRVVNLDFFQGKDLVRNDGIIIFENTHIPYIRDLWNGYVKDQHVQEIGVDSNLSQKIGKVH